MLQHMDHIEASCVLMSMLVHFIDLNIAKSTL